MSEEWEPAPEDARYWISDTTWKQIPDFPDYWVSDDGRVINLRTNRVLKTSEDKFVNKVTLFKDGKKYQRSVRQLQKELLI